MNLLLVNSAEPGNDEFVKPIEKILDNFHFPYDVRAYRQLKNLDFSMYCGVIISGSPQGDDIIFSHQPYFQWVQNFNRPILGICAGHHIIAAMYGAQIFYGKESETGVITIQILKDAVIFDGIKCELNVYAMHNDSVSLPEGFELLASSFRCNNQAMKKSDRDWFTLQFHPEKLNPKIIVNFINHVKMVKNK